MRKKQPVPFAQKFPNVDPLALRLLERLLAFDPKDRPNAEEVCHSIAGLVSMLAGMELGFEWRNIEPGIQILM